jgi:hypothetical protein
MDTLKPGMVKIVFFVIVVAISTTHQRAKQDEKSEAFEQGKTYLLRSGIELWKGLIELVNYATRKIAIFMSITL